jgi:hypothetical protein
MGVWVLLAVALAVRTPLAQAQQAIPLRWAHVTYLTFETAYVDAGTAEGLRIGSRMDVVRGDSAIAVLTISFIATHRAACQILTRTDSVRVGDSVRFTPVLPLADSGSAAAASFRRFPRTASTGVRPTAAPARAVQAGLLAGAQDGGGAHSSQ